MDPLTALSRAQELGASYADVRIESTDEQKIQLMDGELDKFVAGSEVGFGLRVLVDGAWGFASSNDLEMDSWVKGIETAVVLARKAKREPVHMADAPTISAKEIWAPKIDPRDVSVEEKRELLLDMEKSVRQLDEIKSVTTAYSENTLRKEYFNTDGTQVEWGLTRSVAQVHFTARKDGDLAGRGSRVGGTQGWEMFRDEDPVSKAFEAAEACVAQLGAKVPRGGKMTVVVDPDLAGVFAHEAVGHASEADLVAMGESCFKDKLGERVGMDELTIHDDSRIKGAFGSLPYDDNGVRGQDKSIIENGVLVGYLSDRERAAEFGIQANGACRAQDFQNKPLVRMSNTLIKAGKHDESELFEGVKDGIYCRGTRGGQVDTARGTFLFNAQDAFRIQNGEITTPLKDVSLTGGILTTLHQIDALGNQQRLGDPGYCGKGQWVPVSDGGPLVRIQNCLVGGQ
jgi:TldD protein